VRVLIVYDTYFGNTEAVARSMAEALEGAAGVSRICVRRAAEAGPQDVADADLLIVGSPTRAWGMSPAAKAFIQGLRGRDWAGKRALAFDTRFSGRLAGSAARRLAGALRRLGFDLTADPESFYVTGMQGPLAEGELERARALAASLVAP